MPGASRQELGPLPVGHIWARNPVLCDAQERRTFIPSRVNCEEKNNQDYVLFNMGRKVEDLTKEMSKRDRVSTSLNTIYRPRTAG